MANTHHSVFTKHLGAIAKTSPADDITATIDSALRKGDLSSDEITTLTVIKSLVAWGANLALCDWLLQKTTDTKTTDTEASLREQLANVVFGPDPTFLSAEASAGLPGVRAGLFQAEPLVVLGAATAKKTAAEKLPADVSVSSAKFAAWLFRKVGTDAVDLNDPNLASKTIAGSYENIPMEAEADFVPHFHAGLVFFKVLRSLCRIAQEPEDVFLLYEKNWRSVRSVAAATLSNFKNKLYGAQPTEKQAASAAAMHGNAQRVDCWNEHAWLAAIEARRADFVPLEPPRLFPPSKEEAQPTDDSQKDQHTDSSQKLVKKRKKPASANNNLTDMFLLEESACETCCSMTSLTAYFADLMSLLQRTHSKDGSALSMLQVLCRRRPDLMHLELTCANAMTKVPYISLVNEVLESYIRDQANKAERPEEEKEQGKGKEEEEEPASYVAAYNAPEGADLDDHEGVPTYQTGNTDESVYTDLISKQLYPFSVFPYSKARDDAAQIVGGLDLPFLELLETFRDGELLLKDVPVSYWQDDDSPVREKLLLGVEDVLARQMAAESLGLKQQDFAAITGETFFVGWLADLLQGLTKPSAGMVVQSVVGWTASLLWGYGDSTAMTDTAGGLGLSLIKRQLMKRSGLEFQDVLDLVRTQCFNQDLVIVNSSGSGDFEESLEDLRLLGSASKPPFTPLDEGVCWRLQAFIRLRSKMRWSTKDLDAAIVCLRARELETVVSHVPKTPDFFAITPTVIRGLAAISKLSTLSDVEPKALLPLWGQMDAYGESSLLHSKFLTPTLQQLSPVFNKPRGSHQEYLMNDTSYALLDDVDMAVCAALKWPLQSFGELREAAGLNGDGVQLTLDTFSALYRNVLLCQLLSVAPRDCVAFLDLFLSQSVDGNPLDGPEKTLTLVRKWKALFDAGWTFTSLRDVLSSSPPEQTLPNDRRGVRIVASLIQGATDMRNSFPFLFTSAFATPEDVIDCAARTFDAPTAKVVSDFVLGTQVATREVTFASVDALNKAIAAAGKWPVGLKLVPDVGSGEAKAEVRLVGVVGEEDEEAVEGLVGEPGALRQAVKQVYEQATVAEEIVWQRFSSRVADEAVAKGLEVFFPGRADSAETAEAAETETDAGEDDDETDTTKDEAKPKLSELEKQAVAEQVALERRIAFIQISSPIIVEDLVQALINNTIRTVLPDLDPSIIPVLLSSIIRLPGLLPDSDSESAMDVLQGLSKAEQAKTDVLDVYFTPGSTDVYTLSLVKVEEEEDTEDEDEDEDEDPVLSVNGITLTLDENDVWTFPMRGGQSHRLVGNFAPSRLLWSTPKSMTSPFADGMLLPADKADRAEEVLQAVRRAASICDATKLTADELRSLNKAGQLRRQTVVEVDFATPTLEQLVQLQQYRTLREACVPKSETSHFVETGSASLTSLLEWLSRTDTASIRDTAARISVATGWNMLRIDELLHCKYDEGFDDDEAKEKQRTMLSSLRRFETLVGLEAIMRVDKRLSKAAGGSPESLPPMSTLISLAQPRLTLADDQTDLVASQNLRARLSTRQLSKADAYMAEKQRNALVAYLLQQDYILSEGITDADGLLQHFLVDVQMGPQLETSRIKQAISVVQLFAQRCLLGLEPGVAKASLSRPQWEWRKQYSLWEAHVKLFLYPENWLDPALRDDKSQIFDEFEASLMKKDLSLETFAHAAKTYVSSLNDISSLEIVAYLHEPVMSPEVTDRFHFFGCTRASPRVFYHRTLSVLRTTTNEGGKIETKVEGAFWRPWTKIDMDIPVVETEWEGGRLPISGSHLVPVLAGGRLYLFMPQVTAKTVKNEKGFDDATPFDSLRNTTGSQTKPLRAWEVTMGWTELVRGAWAPKRVAAESLLFKADADAKGKLPLPSEFHFEPRYDTTDKDSPIVTILACHISSTDADVFVVLGGFRFCEDQAQMLKTSGIGIEYGLPKRLSLQATEQGTAAKPLGNTFQQVRLETGVSDISGGKFAGKNQQASELPLMWLPGALREMDSKVGDKGKSSAVAWTMSYGRTSASTGLVVSSLRKNGTAVSYFTLPKEDLGAIKKKEVKERDKSVEVVVLDHTFSHLLMRAANRADGVKRVFEVVSGREGLVETFGRVESRVERVEEKKDEKKDKKDEKDDKNDNKDDKDKAGKDGKKNDKPTETTISFHELAQPGSIYNWELCIHTVLLAMDRFCATQQFDEALEVARLVFDPTSEAPLTEQQSCWKFPPFRHVARQTVARKRGNDFKVSSLVSDAGFNLAIAERRSHGALVHATARGRPEAYMKWIVIKYAEALISAGDVHFSRGTLESLPLAIQRYIEASHIIGPSPPKVPKLARRSAEPRTFATLADEDVKLELGLPFSRALTERKPPRQEGEVEDKDARRELMACYLRTTYFCVPLNPRFKELRRKVDERLFNIRNSLDIRGVPVSYALIEPPIDPGALVALSAGGGSMSDSMAFLSGDQDGPLPRQRFELLLQRALELCGELRGLGERLLSVVEKKEGETFTLLRARHTSAVHRMTLALKKAAVTEAQANIDSLLINRSTQETQLAYYLDLIGESRSKMPSVMERWVDIDQDIDKPTKDDLRMSSYEKMEMNMADAAGLLNLVAAGIDGLIAPLAAIPDTEANAAPMGVGASVSYGGKNLSMAISAGSTYIKMLGMIASDEGSRASRKAQLTRQLQDRRLQANMRGREIKSIDKQIEIQQMRVNAAVREVELEESEMEEAEQVVVWYSEKYTGARLYGWMEKSLRQLYYQAYTLAYSTARRAETALSFEQGRSLALLRAGGYFANGNDGLLAADHLYMDLKRLEAAHHDTQKHDYEISKTVSLRQIDPLALLTLRLTGSADFSLGENLFDMDFPGHYLRRLRSVAVSIPAVVGPHGGINATLRLMSHRYRVSASCSPADYLAGERNRSAFRSDHVPLSAVAISSGAHDSGVFELSFTSPRYAPFEGAGAISSWRLELPTAVPRFDYGSVSDVLLHLQYTAVDGGAGLRNAARESVLQKAKEVDREGREEGFWALWDLKNDFVNEWHGLEARLKKAAKDGSAGEEVVAKLDRVKDRLPFWARQQKSLAVRAVTWVSENEELIDSVSVRDAAEKGWKEGDEEKEGVAMPEKKDDVIKDELGEKHFVKTWRNVGKGVVGDGTAWELVFEEPEEVLEGGEGLPTMYMLIHYVFN